MMLDHVFPDTTIPDFENRNWFDAVPFGYGLNRKSCWEVSYLEDMLFGKSRPAVFLPLKRAESNIGRLYQTHSVGVEDVFSRAYPLKILFLIVSLYSVYVVHLLLFTGKPIESLADKDMNESVPSFAVHAQTDVLVSKPIGGSFQDRPSFATSTNTHALDVSKAGCFIKSFISDYWTPLFWGRIVDSHCRFLRNRKGTWLGLIQCLQHRISLLCFSRRPTATANLSVSSARLGSLSFPIPPVNYAPPPLRTF